MQVLRAPSSWTGINSLEVADNGTVFAGECGTGMGVAAWSASGELMWERSFAKPGKKLTLFKEVAVRLAGNDLVVQVRDVNWPTKLEILDGATGKTKKTLKTPGAHAYSVIGDRIGLIGYETYVSTFPGMKRLAKLELYTTSMQVAASPDRRWLAINSDECHVIDLKKARHARSFPLEADVDALAFTQDGLLVCGDDRARLRFYDVGTGKRKAEVVLSMGTRVPRVLALSTSKRHIAASLRGGAVVLLDARKRAVVERFEGHAVKKAGANVLGPGVMAMAFDKAGKTLWVGATTKRDKVGVTAYPVA